MAYEGFKKVEAEAAKSGARNPAAVAAAAGRKKYGKARFQKAAAEGHSMRGMKPKKKRRGHTAREGAEAMMASKHDEMMGGY